MKPAKAIINEKNIRLYISMLSNNNSSYLAFVYITYRSRIGNILISRGNNGIIWGTSNIRALFNI
jgi:hypothetical protein